MKKTFEETINIDINDLDMTKKEVKEKLEEPTVIAETSKIPKVETEDLQEITKKIETSSSTDATLEDIVKNDYQEKTIVQMEIPNDKAIGIASDHRGYKLKQKLTKYLNKKGYTVIDYGSDGYNKNDNYPEYGFKLGEAIRDHKVEKGIAICGSGIGISIACNKVKGVRCAKLNTTKEAKATRIDNDANAMAINGNMPSFRAKDILDVFLKTKFGGHERHKRRVEMLEEYKG